MKHTQLLLILFTISIILSCNNKYKYNLDKSTEVKIIKSKSPKYAKGFKIDYYKNYKKITVFNPWNNNKIFWEYFIYYNDTSKLPKNKNSRFYMHIPKKSIVLSATQIAMFYKLSLNNNITAIADSLYIYNKDVINLTRQKKIQLVGNVDILNQEKVVELNPDIIFTSGWNKINPSLLKLMKLNYNIAFVIDWQEKSLLARAEWIKFIAAIYNKENIADSLFSITESKYKLLLSKVKNINTKPSVMQGSYTADNWYAAGGNSYIAKVFNDAKADYILKNDTNSGSIPIKFEFFFNKAKNADFWFTTENNLVNFNQKIKYFKSVKNNNVYIFTKKINNNGGNDYWETGFTNPDLILKDIIKILHPNIFPDYKLTFFTKIHINKK